MSGGEDLANHGHDKESADPVDSPDTSDHPTPGFSPGDDQLAIDAWMAQHPWAPRLAPFMIYVGFIPVISYLQELAPSSYPFFYTLQCGLVAWVLWRYRKLTPELTLTFHWLAVPVGVAVAVVWIWLRFVMIESFPAQFGEMESTDFFAEMGLAIGSVALGLRFVGMSVLVPLFEELCIRSLMLRSLNSARQTAIGLVQVLEDFPVVGERLIVTRLGDLAHKEPPMFTAEFKRNALGKLSVFGVFASTVIFTAHHLPADWPGCIICALAYCFLLAATAKHGLGPVCWAHGITNALLWAYTLVMHLKGTPDWQFL